MLGFVLKVSDLKDDKKKRAKLSSKLGVIFPTSVKRSKIAKANKLVSPFL